LPNVIPSRFSELQRDFRSDNQAILGLLSTAPRWVGAEKRVFFEFKFYN